jgi:hypothetical protein
VPYTILVLQILAVQFVLGFIAAGITTNMSALVIHTRRTIQRGIWAATGWALLAAIVWDIVQMFLE